jgi:hypothetical protein
MQKAALMDKGLHSLSSLKLISPVALTLLQQGPVPATHTPGRIPACKHLCHRSSSHGDYDTVPC